MSARATAVSPFRRALATAVVLASCLVAEPSHARSQAVVEYPLQIVFSAALRYLRVDLNYKVLERDADAAYLLFEVPVSSETSKEPSRGAVEIVERGDSVVIFVSLNGRPGYEEEAFSRGLLGKLRSEYGMPPARKPVRDREPDKDRDKEKQDPEE